MNPFGEESTKALSPKGLQEVEAFIEGLSPEQRGMCEALAVAGVPISRTGLIGFFEKKSNAKIHASRSEIQSFFEEAELAQWVMPCESSRWMLRPELSGWLCRELISQGGMDEWFDVLDEELESSSFTGSLRRFSPVRRWPREDRYAFRREFLRSYTALLKHVHFDEEFIIEHVWELCGDLCCGSPQMAVDLLEEDASLALMESSLLSPKVRSIDESTAFWEAYFFKFKDQHNLALGALFLQSSFYCARLDLCQAYMERFSKANEEGWLWRAVIELSLGNFDAAVKGFERCLALKKKTSSRRKIRFEEGWGMLYNLALVFRQGPNDLEKAEEVLKLPKTMTKSSLYTGLKALTYHGMGDSLRSKQVMKEYQRDNYYEDPLDILILLYAEFICCGKSGAISDMWILHLRAELERENWPIYQMMFSQWQELSAKEKSPSTCSAPAFSPPTFFHPFQASAEAWEVSLERLEKMVLGESPAEKEWRKAEMRSRLAYRLHYASGAKMVVAIQPVEQKLSVKGVWSAGRNIALKRYKEGLLPESATEQDKSLKSAIKVRTIRRGHWGSTQEYEVNEQKMLPLLEGHPYLFSENNGLPIRLKRGQLQLKIQEDEQGVSMCCSPELLPGQDVLVLCDSVQDWSFYLPTPEQKKIIENLSQNMVFPVKAKNRLQALVSKLSGQFQVEADNEDMALDAKEVEADSRLVLSLSTRGQGLFIHAKVCPLGLLGPSYMPGKGPDLAMDHLEGESLKTRRLIPRELENLRDWEMATGINGDTLVNEGEFIEDPQRCLDVLDVMRSFGEERLLAEWPEGKAKRIRLELSQEDLGLKFSKHHKSKGSPWFEVQGKVELGDGLNMDLKALLLSVSQRQGRYIPLGDGDLAKLSDELLKDLELMSMVEEDEGPVELHPLIAVQLQHLESKSKGRENAEWKQWKKRLQESESMEVKLPSHFEADLRSYQWEGVSWMMRMAHWGAGVCLADDMGLGKTVQTLGVLAARCDLGPAMVICPTSLVNNWLEECVRFAPRLRVTCYGGDDRQAQVEALQKGDVLLCSYGLLQRDFENFRDLNFATMVLDEAQSIKNQKTKRRKAVASIGAEFKIALSGTPIENDINELWSIFDILNPGLLGASKSFAARFDPGDDDLRGERLKSLKGLVSPFLLRRLKRDVLKELPAKTEMVWEVKLSEDERALYETIRETAQQMVASTKAPQRRMEVFAELMRLRRSCCHPQLITQEWQGSSAKCDAFAELAQNLKANGHRALVFSQFVDHLGLLRERLDELGYTYQYLDGQTRPKARAKAVDDFQKGEGDFFLISLKAGGVGLNLTTADYVIHMDPWWNPAVEDQASDRAHRIGQQRPVTVYRLVAKDTIEERIIDLHHHKRDLADAVLDGQGTIRKLDMEELFKLLS